MQKKYGSGGIRTHASEETGALNQRLRPLGHATFGFGSAYRPTTPEHSIYICCALFSLSFNLARTHSTTWAAEAEQKRDRLERCRYLYTCVPIEDFPDFCFPAVAVVVV